MEKIVVNDTNVFIDLYAVGLMEEFFTLPWEVHTTDFVMLELLKEGQREVVARYQEDGRLHVPVFEAKEILSVNELYQVHSRKTNVSFTDCSVWYYAKTNKYTLLTGDRKLRKSSLLDGVEVHGVIYVIDQLVEKGILTARVASQRLKALAEQNPRLPKDAIEVRIKKWENQTDEKGGCL